MFALDSLDSIEEQLPLAAIGGVMVEDVSLEVKGGEVCEIGDDLVEGSGIDGNLFYVYALVLHVCLIHPPFSLHRGLYHVESTSDVGDVLNYRDYLLYL